MEDLKKKVETAAAPVEAVLMAESSEKEEKIVRKRRKRKLKPPAKWGKIKRSVIEKAVKEVIARRSIQ